MSTPPSGEHGGQQSGGGPPRPSWPPPGPSSSSGSAPQQPQQQPPPPPHGGPPPQGYPPPHGAPPWGARPGGPAGPGGPGYGPYPGGGGPPGPRPGQGGRGGGRFPIGLIFLLIMVVLLIVYFTATPTERTPRPTRVDDRLQEVSVQVGTADYKVALINATGVLIDEPGGLLGLAPSPIEQVEKGIARIDADPNVHAMVLVINSPGGGLTASDRLYNLIQTHVEKWRNERPNFQYVVLMEDVAASGGYYIAVDADHIVAHPTTITGSIGVMMQSLNFSELLDTLGIKDRTVTSAPYKDLGNPFSEPQPMEELYFQELIDEMHDRFVDVVYEGRSQVVRDLTRERVREEWADGRIFTAGQAEELGLVDELGYEEDAVSWVQAQIDPNETPNVVRYQPRPIEFSPFSFFGEAGEDGLSMSDAAAAKQLKRLLEEHQREALQKRRVWAIWPPGLAELPAFDAAARAAHERE